MLVVARSAFPLATGWASVIAAALAAGTVTRPVALEVAPTPPPRVEVAPKKGALALADTTLLGTLVDTHSPLRLPLDELSPTPARFDAMLGDPVMRTTHAIDPRLLALVRALARAHPLARIDVVSGFRSPKLNEALRKKGHHVASHSQHSLGQALDLRVVPDGAPAPIDPVALSREVRDLGWDGGVGVYLSPNDRFIHADVGPRRAWYGQ